jgi:hypothetical protein
VQIALDPPPRLVGGVGDARARRPQLRPAVGVGDRGRDELGELLHAALGVCEDRLRFAPAGEHHAPEAALNHDRHARRRLDAQLAQHGGDRAGPVLG